MGLGKTVITLTAVKELLENFAVSRVLVVAPLRVAATVWAEEADKWDHLSGLRFSKVLGSRAEREAALRQEADIYVINRENVPWLVEHFAPSRKWPFDMIVLDELSSFKSPKAERFKAIKRTLPAVRRIVGLTGTPAPNGLIDLWSQIYLLDRGERLGRFVGHYRSQYFIPGHSNGMVVYSWTPIRGAAEEIFGKISDICMSMKAEDYLTMPDRIDLTVPVALPESARKAYETLERDLVLPMKDEAITAQNAAVLAGKLLQLANGAIYSEDGRYSEIHTAKLDALDDLIESANGEPVLVYYGFQHDRDRILRRFPEARVLRSAEDVRDWNAGKIPILVAHPASAGHGLNLQQGGHIMVWYGLTWSLELYQQANARLYRQGQRQPVKIYHLIATDTVDEGVLKILTGKAERQDALIDAVKARIDRYDS
jgi:SNF2 family DNA or RNA helicase